jgi:hypothetical protein
LLIKPKRYHFSKQVAEKYRKYGIKGASGAGNSEIKKHPGTKEK